MYDGIITNSCRDTSSFSDFPFDPERYPDYFGHRQFLQYINEYADHFKLKAHVRLQTSVLACTPNPDDDTWSVTVQEEGKGPEERKYDAVFAATGPLTSPYTPAFLGRELFQGEFLHSQSYRRPGRFEGKKVVLIGLGSAAVDIASELAPGCSEVHMVTRRGGWVMPRYVLGKPIEAWDNRATQIWVPSSISQAAQTFLLNTVQGEHPKELKPDHAILEQNPTIRSEFVERVRNGSIKVHRTTVASITETGLELGDGTTLTADVIMACTGYSHHGSLSYLPSDVLSNANTPPNTVDLWKMTIPLRYPNLFVIGFVELAGPAPPAVEAQARFSAAVISGRIAGAIPTPDSLEKQVRKWQTWQAKHFVRSERHALTEHYVTLLDGLLTPLGANPTFGRLLGRVFTGNPWKALQTLNAVFFGITSSAQWRLCGQGSDEKIARETILRIAGGKHEFCPAEKKRFA
ncbi:flavin-containing monooxygenase [Xylariaceae sp. FL0255]|nr:flavin-containing monooxygenase [Xylariaceae sp. FL0255]